MSNSDYQADYLKLRCIEVRQPIGSFFVGAMKASDLVKISYADVRELREGNDDLRRYVGIQRQLSASRVRKLKKYVTTSDATFPTAVILAIRSYASSQGNDDTDGPELNVRFDEQEGSLFIRPDKGVAKIIDGQHRIEGLADLKDSDFEINVAIFVDMAIEDQAMVFATINLQQTKVSKSLAYDLYEYEKQLSPQKTCHDIARLLNADNDSPFKGKIKVLGKAEGPDETITQATFIDRLMVYVSTDPVGDRDKYRRGKTPARADAKQRDRLIFRDMFLEERDEVIARNIGNFFSVARSKWPQAWDEVERGNILNRTTGFGALMRFLRLAYLHCSKDSQGIVSEKGFLSVFENITLESEDFTPDAFKPGSSGEGLLFRTLKEQTGLG